MVPDIAVQREVAARALAAVRIRGMKPRDIGVVTHESRQLSAAAAALLEIVRSELKGQRL